MYYVVKTTIENGQHTEDILAYESKKEGLVAYHNTVAGTIVFDSVVSAVFMFIDHDGAVIQIDRYFRDEDTPIDE